MLFKLLIYRKLFQIKLRLFLIIFLNSIKFFIQIKFTVLQFVLRTFQIDKEILENHKISMVKTFLQILKCFDF